MEQQGRTAVRAHQGEREEARPQHEDGEAHRCRDGEQGALVGRAHQVEEVIFEEIVVAEALVVEEVVRRVAQAFLVEEVVIAEALVEEALTVRVCRNRNQA